MSRIIGVELPKRIEMMSDGEKGRILKVLNRLTYALYIGDEKAEKEICKKFKLKILREKIS